MRLISVLSLTRRLPVVTFFALILLPVFVIGYDGPWPGPGDISIRPRAPFPTKFAPGSFSNFDEWFADRVGFRYPLIYAGTGLHVGLLRRPLDRHIIFGRDDWMFWTDDREIVPATMADSRGKLQFSASEIKRIDSQIRTIQERFAGCGLPTAIFIAPNKQSLYGEFLINRQPPQSRLDGLMAALSEPARAVIIDPRPRMYAAKLSHAPVRLYNKTETHWNDLGAFYGYLSIIDALARTTPVAHVELASLDRYHITVTRYPGGDMATRVLFSPWRFADDNVGVAPKVAIAGEREIMIDRRHFIHRNPRGKGRLLMFSDSFGSQLVPFLAQHFAEVYRYVGEEIDGLVVERLRPDVVLFQLVERYAGRLLTPHINLPRVCQE
jgi:alginate O-acetyltransferase complex protein AlgJ